MRRTRKKKSNKKTKKFRKMTCAPKKNSLKYTCYTNSALRDLKNAWNKRHPHCKILTNQSREIWERLRDNMVDSCKKESCWLKHNCIKNDIDINKLNKMFAPQSPDAWKKNKFEWLSTNDIQNAMQQWESYDNTFKFLVHPR